MKTTAQFVIAFLVCLPPLEMSAKTVVFPTPNGVEPSPHFIVELHKGGVWMPSFVYFNPARTDGAGSGDQPGRSMSWSIFQTDESVRVRVRANNGTAEGIVVRPSRHEIVPERVDEQTVEFSVEPGQKLSVEFDHLIRENCFTGPPHGIPCVMHGILIFAGAMPAADPLATYADDDIAVIEPGLHAMEKPVTNLPNRTAHLSTLSDAGGKRVTFNFADTGGKGLMENFHFENIAIEGAILRLFGFKAMKGQVIRDFHFKNLSVGAMGAGQLGAPGRNYFIGDIGKIDFNDFTIDGERGATLGNAWFEFAEGAGEGFMLDGKDIKLRPVLTVED